jgi:hypothetical protein
MVSSRLSRLPRAYARGPLPIIDRSKSIFDPLKSFAWKMFILSSVSPKKVDRHRTKFFNGNFSKKLKVKPDWKQHRDRCLQQQ